MESENEIKGILKQSNSNSRADVTSQKQVSIDSSNLPFIQSGNNSSSSNFEFMAKDLSKLDNEERLEQKLAFYFQPYSSNGYEFGEYMKFDRGKKTIFINQE